MSRGVSAADRHEADLVAAALNLHKAEPDRCKTALVRLLAAASKKGEPA